METSSRYPIGKGTVRWVRDATANDSDKTMLTVPTGKLCHLRYASGQLSCTATVGNRQLIIFINNGTNNVFPTARIQTTASQTGDIATWYGAPRSTTPGDIPLYDGGAGSVGSISSCPDLWLPAGYTVRVADYIAIDPAADDLTAVISYEEYDA